VRDAAYETLLKSERQRLHARIARTLEERFSELSDTQPELVAYHCTQAGLAEKAVGYWQKAGQRAIERSAGTEAVAHFDRALKLLAALPEGSERDRQELRLRAGLGAQLAVTRGYAASAVQDAFGRAWELCRGLEDAAESFPVLFGLWRYYLARGQLLTSRKVADRCLASAERAGDPSLLIEARHALAWSLFALGEPRPARAHLEQALASYSPTEHSSLAFVYGTDPGAHSLSLLSWALWVLGYPAQALQRNREAIALAQELTHPVTRAVCHLYAAVTRQFRREIGEAQSEAEAAITICQERGVGYYLAMATTVRGWALAARGQGEEALAEMGRGLAAVDATGAEVARPYWIGLLAEAWGRTGRPAEGLRWLEEALATAARNRDRWYEAELHRLRGELLLAGHGSAAEAEACFRRAIQAARRQGARSLELRAATSLARLWHGQDRRAEARDLLAPVHGWFTEGLDTPDLREAKLLLDELGSPQNLPRIVR
jgi:predicted ATPase